MRKNWQSTGTAFAQAAVNQGLQKRFQLPLFTDGILRTGVYKTFKEFKNNSPSLTDIKIDWGKGVPDEIRDAYGNKIDMSNYWGVFAGNTPFIFFREKFYALLPSDRSFRFLSYTQTKDLYQEPGTAQTSYNSSGTSNRKSRQFFYLNMDEEEIYLEEIFGKSRLKEIQKDLLK